ncbi:KAP family NTPase [Halomonas heilongjiangensis]|uniref:KAP P-loop protein n=1 Tax=Halomonas heilongjiangensis TaxID=1387883 RepID=A0A2N7TU56_9GAMM|nr:KAP family NTPase [Halomonas heilongjiangensis]PMR71724.1 KAP P-loop protein [Halomonas heilongjiangensis]PXX89995.1 KAP P-loop protein [Halomonas heilongjiangensis]
MKPNKPVMKMPEFLVFAKLLAVGFLGAEVWRASYYLGANSALASADLNLYVKCGLILFVALLCVTYALKRGAHVAAARVGRSLRIDLLIAVGIGIWVNVLASPWLAKAHSALKGADSHWATVVLLLLSAVLLSPLVQHSWPRNKRSAPQLYFIADEEVRDEKEDLFASETQAKSFAETVLASGAHPGLVFGVDGPWGVGKTSFINLAERYWKNAEDRAIVCRFEPLRYASQPDLADRLIRELSAAIQRKVFAPEFRPAVSRYSRLIKGKADFSFLGFRLSFEPSQETVDELLDDIDEVLRRIGRRVIIVIDDLDRLDTRTTNNVLFATKRTFKISQATYVLCYDTEILAGSEEEGARAREFLEKFVTVKLSLFVDSSSIRDFLRRDWQLAENHLGSIPSDTMVKLGAVLNELADILNGELAAKYLPLVGDMRKVKRFVNAMLLMQIEKSDLGRTDFNKRDLINLMLLHLNYPGLFRRIYAEETEGRSGIFSVRREYGERNFKNSSEFLKIVEESRENDGFLLKQLFEVATLKLGEPSDVDEAVLSSRACFNEDSFRNLEGYLKLIVRFATPEPQETFVLYQTAVERVRMGETISSVLTSPDFQLERGEHAHDQFWRVLVNQSHDFTSSVSEDAIDTLVDYLPYYSAIAHKDRGLRIRSIYSLLRLLDQAGWGRTSGHRLPNTPENIIKIAWRIFGEHSYKGKGILQRLVADDRGVLGWSDLMLFRLQCSADRQGQLFNLHSALIVHQDNNAATSGPVSSLALIGMRKLSQKVFALFKRTYIDSRRNFFAEVNDTSAESFLGEVSSKLDRQASSDDQFETSDASFAQLISSARSVVKSFVIYQLSNSLPPQGSGIGCGHYDERGAGDGGGIAKLMNEYAFDVCFNPDLHEDNIIFFLDHCLSHLSNGFFSGRDEEGYFASKAELPGGLDPKEMGRYWSQHRDLIRQRVPLVEERCVVTTNYIASYRDDLDGVFAVLDELAMAVSSFNRNTIEGTLDR